MKLSLKKSLASLLATVMMLSSAASLAAVPGATSTYPDSTTAAYNETLTRGDNLTIVTRGDDVTDVPTAPVENLFTVGGKVYNMLDTDANGNYFIMTNFGGGSTNHDKGYTGTGTTYADMRFNATNTASAANTLQADLGTYVPSADMQAKVLEYTWYDEHDPVDCINYTTCKLAFPSLTELDTYKDEINWSLIDKTNWIYMPTRTVAYNSAKSKYEIITVQHYLKPKHEIAMWGQFRNGVPNAPVVFFLNKDFFKTVKVDVTAGVGANVLAEIKKYTVDDLSAIYTINELGALGFDLGEDNSDQVPTAYRSAIAGLTGSTEMKDKDGNSITSSHAKYENLSAEFTFKVGGKEFILLNNDETGDHFVTFKDIIMEANMGSYLWADKTSTNKMDYVFNVNNTNSVAATLNGSAWINTYIPEAMRSQLKEKVWWTEHDVQAYEDINLWKTTAKIALPSYTEIKANSDRYPFGKVPSNAREWMRTFNVTSTGAIQAVGLIDEESEIRSSALGHYGGYFRPVFYVDKDFFKNVKVDDIAALGSGIKAEIVADYTAQDLATIYTTTELAQLGFDLGEDNSSQVPAEYRNALSSITGGTAMLDKTGAQITSTHASYGNLSDDYTFKVGGKSFVLLSGDETGDHFVTFKTNMYESSVGNLWSDKTLTNKESYVFSTSNANSVASTLNGSAWINGNIPEAMRSQLKEKVWWTEHDVVAYENIDAWKTTAKIALPSYAEIKANSDRFPFGNIPTAAREWMRSFKMTSTGAVQAIGLIQEGNLVKSSASGHYGGHFRPVFYVDKDFFKNVKVDDVVALGSGIKAEIVETYKIEDLLGLYTPAELVTIGYDEDDVRFAADRILVKGYPTEDAYSAAFAGSLSGDLTAGATTPAENLFKVGDKEFIYLDADDEGNMFVMAKSYHQTAEGELPFPSTAVTDAEKLYNASTKNSIAWNFNSKEYIDRIVPTALQKYLLNHKWYVETNEATPYYTTAKVALPSATEIMKYWNKIGGWSTLNMDNSNTRTPYYKDGSIASNITVWVNNTVEPNKLLFNKLPNVSLCAYQRPVFFVDKYYFLDTVVNADDMGANVKQFIRASFTKSELKENGYDEATLVALGFAAEPSATNILIDAQAYAEGQTLTGSYTFVADATGMPEDVANSTYQWYRSNDAGAYTAIAGATGLSYVLTSDDVGKYIKFAVRPANLDGRSTTEYFSQATTKIAKKAEFLFDVVLKDDEGNDVDNINGETALEAILTITNLKAAAENKELIIAVYDDKNVLRAVNMAQTLIGVGEDDYPITVDGFTGAANWTAKVMVWDNLQTMEPLFGQDY